MVDFIILDQSEHFLQNIFITFVSALVAIYKQLALEVLGGISKVLFREQLLEFLLSSWGCICIHLLCG